MSAFVWQQTREQKINGACSKMLTNNYQNLDSFIFSQKLCQQNEKITAGSKSLCRTSEQLIDIHSLLLAKL
jgi:hypothetical protein